MKYLISVLLVLLPLVLFGEIYEYKSLPEKIECSIDLDISVRSPEGKVSSLPVKIALDSGKIENGAFEAEFTNNISYRNEKKKSRYVIKNNKSFLDIEALSDISLYPETGMSHKIMLPVPSFPETDLSVGGRWQSETINPIYDSRLMISSRIMRVADKIATVYYSVKNPYIGNYIQDEEDLLRQKIEDGSAFYLRLDTLSGHAEISGSGVWFFDTAKGCVISGESFYKITSLMRKDNRAEIEKFNDFYYADIYMRCSYKFR